MANFSETSQIIVGSLLTDGMDLDKTKIYKFEDNLRLFFKTIHRDMRHYLADLVSDVGYSQHDVMIAFLGRYPPIPTTLFNQMDDYACLAETRNILIRKSVDFFDLFLDSYSLNLNKEQYEQHLEMFLSQIVFYFNSVINTLISIIKKYDPVSHAHNEIMNHQFS
jgi:hypothetical protein